MVIPIDGNDNPKEAAYDGHIGIVQDNLRFLKPTTINLIGLEKSRCAYFFFFFCAMIQRRDLSPRT